MGERVERFSIGLAQHSLQRLGVLGVIIRLVTIASRSIARWGYVHERHLWYALDLTAVQTPAALPDGFELFRAGPDDHTRLEELKTVGGHEASERYAAGAELWLVREGAR